MGTKLGLGCKHQPNNIASVDLAPIFSSCGANERTPWAPLLRATWRPYLTQVAPMNELLVPLVRDTWRPYLCRVAPMNGPWAPLVADT